MLVEVVDDYERMSDRAAAVVSEQIRNHPDSTIGFATGSTPVGLYDRLIEQHRQDSLDFSDITGFNLDEYIGLAPDHSQSYHYYMEDKLFGHVNIDPANVHIPDGLADDIEGFCDRYETQIEQSGGIDLQILGIGANGHIGFNEPGSSLGSRTRIKSLASKTIRDNARFFEREEEIPRRAITMGIGTIMDAERLVLLASGARKSAAIKATLEGPVTAMVPATVIQMHPDAHVIIDEDAADKLDYNHHDGIAEPKN